MNPSRGLCPRCTVQQEEQLLLHYPEDLISPFLFFSKADLLFLTRSGITSILLFILFSLPPIPLPILICSLLYFSALFRPDLLSTFLFLNSAISSLFCIFVRVRCDAVACKFIIVFLYCLLYFTFRFLYPVGCQTKWRNASLSLYFATTCDYHLRSSPTIPINIQYHLLYLSTCDTSS